MAKFSYWLAVGFLFIPAALCCVVLLAVTFPLFILTTVSSMSFTSLRLFVAVLLHNAQQKRILREDEVNNQLANAANVADQVVEKTINGAQF